MALQITVDGDNQILAQGIDAFARENGWAETVVNEAYDPDDPNSLVEIPNPVSQLDFSTRILGAYFREVVKSYNAKIAAEAASVAAKDQTDEALSSTTITSTIG